MQAQTESLSETQANSLRQEFKSADAVIEANHRADMADIKRLIENVKSDLSRLILLATGVMIGALALFKYLP